MPSKFCISDFQLNMPCVPSYHSDVRVGEKHYQTWGIEQVLSRASIFGIYWRICFTRKRSVHQESGRCQVWETRTQSRKEQRETLEFQEREAHLTAATIPGETAGWGRQWDSETNAPGVIAPEKEVELPNFRMQRQCRSDQEEWITLYKSMQIF